MAMYEYLCENERCGRITEIELPLRDDKPASIPCENCGSPAKRYWKGSKIILPENFKAMGDSAPWENRFGKFNPGQKGKVFKGGGTRG